jgi:hypothetical protein
MRLPEGPGLVNISELLLHQHLFSIICHARDPVAGGSWT